MAFCRHIQPHKEARMHANGRLRREYDKGTAQRGASNNSKQLLLTVLEKWFQLIFTLSCTDANLKQVGGLFPPFRS